ncbi:catechol 2,3-dioxygenase-like lactoylglutathione lyase family enzyme [Bradyrhizobium macuxiense]|uniref:Catechol 2,3-dioxygenase-like lactoylglutathione lyase family enzyme n=1 Tax=Bradyrhizobium macuxiense TaxID=1755647 RepID=A0A560KX55_9BRAD|nr:VOC family protein [Bradyrhizobium macuxiense]TWB87813.1 catechol 2,3-dioxygenase-like lactoylglutathione lyase family enzyme [Bradyrhizobium macuxiense]
MSTMPLDELKKATSTLSGTWISEVVLQTARFDEMKTWYEAVLGRPFNFETAPKDPTKAKRPDLGDKQVRASDIRACFMKLDPSFPYGGTFALFELPWLDRAPGTDPGLNHMQFKNADLDTLIKRLELLRDGGIHPQRSANHGPGLSFYFKDPDKNVVEFCINNFASLEETLKFTQSERFRNNPSGLELDRDEFIARYRSGVPQDQLLAI